MRLLTTATFAMTFAMLPSFWTLALGADHDAGELRARSRASSPDGASSGARMGASVRGANMILRDVRVNLGSAEIGVAEHRLHGAEISAAAQEVRRE